MRNMKKKFQIIDNTTEALKISLNPILSVLKTLKEPKLFLINLLSFFGIFFIMFFFAVINV